MPVMSLTQEELDLILGPIKESIIDDEIRDAITNLPAPAKGKKAGIKFGPVPKNRAETARNICYHVLKQTSWYRPKTGKIPGNAGVRSLSKKDDEEQYFAVIRFHDEVAESE